MSETATTTPRAVLFDRDGTLVVDVPYNSDPAQVQVMPTTAVTLRMLRAAKIPIGVMTNQSGIGRGILTDAEVAAVNHRVDELLGPFDVWEVCPHGPDDECDCRKPRPGMILAAARELGVAPADIAVVGDIGADIQAATAAGARGVMVPTRQTRVEDVRDATLVAPDVASAVALLFGGDGPSR
jgi:D-glycero-D-manno-heptose 1,7-bisphosphate phosphatase